MTGDMPVSAVAIAGPGDRTRRSRSILRSRPNNCSARVSNPATAARARAVSLRTCLKGPLSFSLSRNKERPMRRKQAAALGVIAVPSPQVTKAGKLRAHPDNPDNPNTMEKTAAVETNVFSRLAKLPSEGR